MNIRGLTRMNETTLANSNVSELALLGRGEVREIYDLSDALFDTSANASEPSVNCKQQNDMAH